MAMEDCSYMQMPLLTMTLMWVHIYEHEEWEKGEEAKIDDYDTMNLED